MWLAAGVLGVVAAGQVMAWEADRYRGCDINDYCEITDIVEKPDEPSSNSS